MRQTRHDAPMGVSNTATAGLCSIETVDDDLGRSAAGGTTRAGFERNSRRGLPRQARRYCAAAATGDNAPHPRMPQVKDLPLLRPVGVMSRVVQSNAHAPVVQERYPTWPSSLAIGDYGTYTGPVRIKSVATRGYDFREGQEERNGIELAKLSPKLGAFVGFGGGGWAGYRWRFTTNAAALRHLEIAQT
jgi:hypothetical protein